MFFTTESVINEILSQIILVYNQGHNTFNLKHASHFMCSMETYICPSLETFTYVMYFINNFNSA